jgi:hypothetical protein
LERKKVLKKLVASGLLLVIAVSCMICHAPHVSSSGQVYDYKALSSYVAMAPYSWKGGAESISQNSTREDAVENFTLLAKQMGFHGIAIHNVELFYLDHYLATYLDLLRAQSLDTAIYISFRDFTYTFSFSPDNTHIPSQFWNVSGFPNNNTQVQVYLNMIDNITQITKSYDDIIKFYLVYYPWDWANLDASTANLVNSSALYNECFQEAISNVVKNAGGVPVMPISDMIETVPGAVDYIPYNLTGISGYAFDFYSHTNNTLNQHGDDSLEWYVNFWNDAVRTYLNGNGTLFFAEWGWNTGGNASDGICTDEESKAELIEEELKDICLEQPTDRGCMPFTYCFLHDFPPENADWGLAYWNCTLKPSGVMMQRLLRGSASFDPELFGVGEPLMSRSIWENGSFSLQSAFDAIKSLNVTMLRETTWMKLLLENSTTGITVNPEHAQILDWVISNMTAMNVSIMGMAQDFPPWMTGINLAYDDSQVVPYRNVTIGSDYMNFLQNYSESWEKLAARFPKITMWEIGNEYNADPFLHPQGFDINNASSPRFNETEKADITTDLLYYGSSGVHLGNPNATTVLGGLSPGSGLSEIADFLNLTYQRIESRQWPHPSNNTGDYFQIACWHPYLWTVGPNETNWIDPNNAIHEIMVNHGDGSKRVIFSEFGYNDNDNTPEDISRYLLETFQLARDNFFPWLKTIYWFRLIDPAPWTVNASWNPSGFGLFDLNWRPKPLEFTYESLISSSSKTEQIWDFEPDESNAAAANNSWSVSRTLNQGDFFKLEIYPALDWNQSLEQPGLYNAQFEVRAVNITDPSGEQTEFECAFLQLSSNTSKPLVFYDIAGTGPNETIEKHGIDNVTFEVPCGSNTPGIVARALSSGNYTANITSEGGGSPPFNMTISRGDLLLEEHKFVTLDNYYVDVFSNSTIDNVYFSESNKTITMYFSNSTTDQTHGLCKLTIPHALLSPPYNVTANGNAVSYDTLYEDETLSTIQFTYEHSEVSVVVTPEFPSFLILPLFMIAVLVVVIIGRRRATQSRL